MRLIDPGPGDILDRLTILALKIVYGKQAGRSVDLWGVEYAALCNRVADAAWIARLLELAAVNGALWQAEDEMRRLRQPFETPGIAQSSDRLVQDVASCGARIQTLNDRRAELITLINVNAGLDRPSDKV